MYEEKKLIINENKKSIFPFSKDIDLVHTIIESEDKSKAQDVYDLLNNAMIQEDSDDAESLDAIDTSELPMEPNAVRKPKDGCKFKPIIPDAIEEMKLNVRKLSFEQRIVFDKIISYCKDVVMSRKCNTFNPSPPKIIVHGGGGVGKTFLINAISKWAEEILRESGTDPLDPIVLLIAPTGKSANLIGGSTMHSALDCRFGTNYNHLTPEKIGTFRRLFEHLQLVIVDEMSMISSDSLYDIDHRLRDILMFKEAFAGRAMMLNGDLLQLPPIQGASIFEMPRSSQNKAIASSIEIDSCGNKRKGIWKQMDVVNLQTNFRQGKGSWVECLNRIRVLKEFSDLEQEYIDLLESRRIELHPDKNLEWAIHVFYTNLEVCGHNIERLGLINGNEYEIIAIISSVAGYTPFIKKHGTIEDTNFLKILNVKVGARVVLISNIDVSDSLVNGSTGTIVEIKTDNGKVSCIVVDFDSPGAGQNQRKNYPMTHEDQAGCPIFQIKQEYTRKGKGKQSRGSLIQYPVQLAWASTAHKLQGDTIPKGKDFVVHGHKRMPKSMGYVMLSRCSNIENLYIDKSFIFEKHLLCNLKSLKAKEELDKRDISKHYANLDFDLYYVKTRSLKGHFEDIRADMYAMNSKYLCFVETWFPKTEKVKDFSLKGYNMTEVSNGPGKGCVTYVKEEEEVKSYSKIDMASCESISFKMAGRDIQLTLVYLSSHSQLIDVKKMIEKIPSKAKHHIIIGDFNFSSKESNILTDLFTKQMGLSQIIERPTHKDGRTIDHCYMSPEINYNIPFINHYYTDHSAICIKLK